MNQEKHCRQCHKVLYGSVDKRLCPDQRRAVTRIYNQPRKPIYNVTSKWLAECDK